VIISINNGAKCKMPKIKTPKKTQQKQNNKNPPKKNNMKDDLDMI
jgi:hypothetical protein